MNPGMIWWGQIGNSLRLLDRIANDLRDRRSAVLRVPGRFPWRETFYEAVDLRRSSFGGERRLRRIPWEEGADPGAYILDKLCSERVRADYWPGQTYGAYLGARDDIVLCDYYVWITGIRSKADMARWVEFITQYIQAAGQAEQRAVFLLEYEGPMMDAPGLDRIDYSVESYDCRVFALETANVLCAAEARAYQAELALSLAGGDPELCCALLQEGERLLRDPVGTALEVCKTALSSSGEPFSALEEQQAASAAWEAALVLLFPILERFRMGFIKRFEGELWRHLPISNSNGDEVRDPQDLDIGPLFHIVTACSKAFSPAMVEAIRLCRHVRNLLAHNKLVPYEDVKKLLELKQP